MEYQQEVLTSLTNMMNLRISETNIERKQNHRKDEERYVGL